MKDFITDGVTLFKRFAAINRTISTSLSFEEALGLITGSGLELAGAGSCLVLLQEDEGALRICAAQGVDSETAERFRGPMEESILDKLRQDLGFAPSKNIAAFPVMSDRILQGILVVISDAPLTKVETSLLSALADQAAITLANAHRYETVKSREAKLQDELDRSRNLARELDAVIHSVAQDLRTPLGTMTACGKGLLDKGSGQVLTDEGRENLVRMVAAARLMDAMIRDLLDYNRMAAELTLEPVDLGGVVAEALAGLRAEIDSRGGVVRVESSLLKVLAHRSTLVKLLGNVISHAVKRIRTDKQPLVEVKAELLGEFVRVSVLDNPDHERLDRAEEVPGMGIRLAVVRRGLERMGGRCGSESKSGKGSRFWIDLRGA